VGPLVEGKAHNVQGFRGLQSAQSLICLSLRIQSPAWSKTYKDLALLPLETISGTFLSIDLLVSALQMSSSYIAAAPRAFCRFLPLLVLMHSTGILLLLRCVDPAILHSQRRPCIVGTYVSNGTCTSDLWWAQVSL